MLSYIYKAMLYFYALFGWISHGFVNKFGFSIDRNSNRSIYICHILLTKNVRDFQIEHATWLILVSKCSLFFYLQ